MDAYELLLTRASSGKLREPGPDDATLHAIVHAALRAPDHGLLRPWRIQVVRGQDLRASFKVPEAERFTHVFCSTCGGGSALERGERAMVPAASLDADPGIIEHRHILLSSKAPWEILPNDGWLRYDQYPPQ